MKAITTGQIFCLNCVLIEGLELTKIFMNVSSLVEVQTKI
jgi:hypothetical protein